jgi:hypothetical protein
MIETGTSELILNVPWNDVAPPNGASSRNLAISPFAAIVVMLEGVVTPVRSVKWNVMLAG